MHYSKGSHFNDHTFATCLISPLKISNLMPLLGSQLTSTQVPWPMWPLCRWDDDSCYQSLIDCELYNPLRITRYCTLRKTWQPDGILMLEQKTSISNLYCQHGRHHSPPDDPHDPHQLWLLSQVCQPNATLPGQQQPLKPWEATLKLTVLQRCADWHLGGSCLNPQVWLKF